MRNINIKKTKINTNMIEDIFIIIFIWKNILNVKNWHLIELIIEIITIATTMLK